MCSQKLDRFPGWTHLNLMTLSERRMFPLSCHFVRNLSHPWSAVIEGRTQDAKEDDRKDIRELLGRVIFSRSGSTPTTGPYLGFGFQMSSLRIQYSIQPCAGSICIALKFYGTFCVPGPCTRSVFSENPRSLKVRWCESRLGFLSVESLFAAIPSPSAIASVGAGVVTLLNVLNSQRVWSALLGWTV